MTRRSSTTSARIHVVPDDLSPGSFELLATIEGLGPGDEDEFSADDSDTDDEFSEDEFEDAEDELGEDFDEDDEFESEDDLEEDDELDDDEDDADFEDEDGFDDDDAEARAGGHAHDGAGT